MLDCGLDAQQLLSSPDARQRVEYRGSERVSRVLSTTTMEGRKGPAPRLSHRDRKEGAQDLLRRSGCCDTGRTQTVSDDLGPA